MAAQAMWRHTGRCLNFEFALMKQRALVDGGREFIHWHVMKALTANGLYGAAVGKIIEKTKDRAVSLALSHLAGRRVGRHGVPLSLRASLIKLPE
jgi:hypothetical protein